MQRRFLCFAQRRIPPEAFPQGRRKEEESKKLLFLLNLFFG
ncbi:MAG TPA: hypothetical protein VK184_20055 [Nostocaceae cyanobacterium]|nr:hypothetical protein [Nostocaceae cyanobacterium]